MRLHIGWMTLLVAISTMIFVGDVAASVVKFETVAGDIHVQLYDRTTPQTVENFLNYVNGGDYDQSFIHRSIPDFVVQGGGFTWHSDTAGVESVASNPAVVNEPVHSNLRGTIAMAKLGGDPDSATSQWFFNLADNSENLDNQNGGFTVFGHVIGDGMTVVDAIGTMMRVNAGSPFDNLPVRNWDQQSAISGSNLILIERAFRCAAGDVDCDGEAGMLDLSLMGNHWGDQQASWLEGDLNNDGAVGLLDLDILGKSFSHTSQVPEPGTLVGLVISAIMCIRREKNRKLHRK